MAEFDNIAEKAKAIASRRERVEKECEAKERSRDARERRTEKDKIREAHRVVEEESVPTKRRTKFRAETKAARWAEDRISAQGLSETVPRDFFERNPLDWSAPEETKRHVHVFFDSEYREQRNPILPTFDAQIYEPLTKDRAEELGIVVPAGRWTEQGYLKVGHDAIVKIAPRRIVDSRDKMLAERYDITRRMRKHEETYRIQAQAIAGKSSGGEDTMAFGDINVSGFDDERDVIAASAGGHVQDMRLSGPKGYEGYVPTEIEEENEDG
jgi:hypothetical protein